MYGAGLSSLNIYKLENGLLSDQNVIFKRTGTQGKG
jgi:hypothetical protein